MLIEHVGANPLHAPLQAASEPPAGSFAVSVTFEPTEKNAPQVAPQSIPAGLLVTPLPAGPETLSASLKLVGLQASDTAPL